MLMHQGVLEHWLLLSLLLAPARLLLSAEGLCMQASSAGWVAALQL